MPSLTTYRPVKVADFEATKLNYDAYGTSMIVTAGSTQNLDHTLTDDCLITGAWLVTSDGYCGDTASFQVVDTSGAFTGVPGYVISQFVTHWYLPSTTDTQLELAYPAKIYAGLTLRLVYHSTGVSNPFIAINYKLHKVLV